MAIPTTTTIRMKDTITAMTTATAIRTDVPATALDAASLLDLIWLASPALPVGGFSYSEGLEAAVEWAGVKDEASAALWLVDQLHLTFARADLAVLAQAVPAWRANDRERLTHLTAWVLATRESAELRLQTEQMGRSFVEWLKLRHADAASCFAGLPATYPVAFAFAVSRTGAPVRDAALAFAFGWAENMVAAAVRAVPLGQSAGQRILARLAADIPAAVDTAIALADDARQAFSPRLAILSARHETQYSRLFRS
jgi:urease accessory protein